MCGCNDRPLFQRSSDERGRKAQAAFVLAVLGDKAYCHRGYLIFCKREEGESKAFCCCCLVASDTISLRRSSSCDPACIQRV